MTRPSLALGADDLGLLKEGDESNEDVLRRQLLERDRECERVSLPLAPGGWLTVAVRSTIKTWS